ncbi:hypothetical protein FIBSPDRAFT_463373 [Athelia psychrophila]|uniref:Uncharacterized protein n=1 Tax=Athelia psychrophila TaxID=1759441 RepID=A0A166LPI2_9AGAM|nr:hypothetical protein FIBSPDRAFT_463373 [Fibularhizoctonia sp. CBS 109695]
MLRYCPWPGPPGGGPAERGYEGNIVYRLSYTFSWAIAFAPDITRPENTLPRSPQIESRPPARVHRRRGVLRPARRQTYTYQGWWWSAVISSSLPTQTSCYLAATRVADGI